MHPLFAVSSLLRRLGGLALIVVVGGLAGCRGDKLGPDGYFIRFEADGAAVLLTENILVTPNQTGDLYVVLVSGNSKQHVEESANLQLFSLSPIEEGLYTEMGNPPALPLGASVGYDTRAGNFFVSVSRPARITVEEVTDKTMRGSFTATVGKNGFPDIVLTEGTFYGPINR